MRFGGRKILITGAASGIGLEVARKLAEEGAALGLLDINEEKLRDCGVDSAAGTHFCAVDVTSEEAVASAVDQIAAQLGGIDGVINCAGVDFIGSLAETTSAIWTRVMATNLNGPFHVCRAALPHLQKAKGATIVNVASAAGLRPLEHRTAYCASKAALVMFTKTLAAELSADEIRANVVCPGIVETPLFRDSFQRAKDPEAELKRIIDRYVIKRAGRPEEIASAVMYLSSHESSYVTGSALAVDGGRSFH